MATATLPAALVFYDRPRLITIDLALGVCMAAGMTSRQAAEATNMTKCAAKIAARKIRKATGFDKPALRRLFGQCVNGIELEGLILAAAEHKRRK